MAEAQIANRPVIQTRLADPAFAGLPTPERHRPPAATSGSTDPLVAARDAAQHSHRLYMTSELRSATGVSRTHLDFYLREGLIVPTTRTESGYLLFDERELATLRAIIAERQSGVGLREIRARLGR